MYMVQYTGAPSISIVAVCRLSVNVKRGSFRGESPRGELMCVSGSGGGSREVGERLSGSGTDSWLPIAFIVRKVPFKALIQAPALWRG